MSIDADEWQDYSQATDMERCVAAVESFIEDTTSKAAAEESPSITLGVGSFDLAFQIVHCQSEVSNSATNVVSVMESSRARHHPTYCGALLCPTLDASWVPLVQAFGLAEHIRIQGSTEITLGQSSPESLPATAFSIFALAASQSGCALPAVLVADSGSSQCLHGYNTLGVAYAGGMHTNYRMMTISEVRLLLRLCLPCFVTCGSVNSLPRNCCISLDSASG